MLKRVMGKASFITLQDLSGRIQVYVSRDHIGESDLRGVQALGHRRHRRRRRHAVSHAHRRTDRRVLGDPPALTKSLRPLPEKFHGLTDQEQKYRMRYVDLITNEQSRFTFAVRSRSCSRSATTWSPRLPRSRDADDAPDPRRRHGPALRHPPQRARHGCSCASRPSSTSSGWSSAASKRSSRSTATSATKASARATTPNSR
jgi:hypothetical protein